jgi:hypothetical protein
VTSARSYGFEDSAEQPFDPIPTANAIAIVARSLNRMSPILNLSLIM